MCANTNNKNTLFYLFLLHFSFLFRNFVDVIKNKLNYTYI